MDNHAHLFITDHEELSTLLAKKLQGIPDNHIPAITLDAILNSRTSIPSCTNIPPDLALPFFLRNRGLIDSFGARPVKSKTQDVDVTRAIWYYRLDTRRQFVRHHDVVRWNIALFIGLLGYDGDAEVGMGSEEYERGRGEMVRGRGLGFRRGGQERGRGRGRGYPQSSRRSSSPTHQNSRPSLRRDRQTDRRQEERYKPYARRPEQHRRNHQHERRDGPEKWTNDVAVPTAAKEFMKTYLRAVYEQHNPPSSSSSSSSTALGYETSRTSLSPSLSPSSLFVPETTSHSSHTSLLSSPPSLSPSPSRPTITPTNTSSSSSPSPFHTRESFLHLWKTTPHDLFTSFTAAQKRVLKTETKRLGKEWDDILKSEDGGRLVRFVGSLIGGVVGEYTDRGVLNPGDGAKEENEKMILGNGILADGVRNGEIGDISERDKRLWEAERKELLEALRVPFEITVAGDGDAERNERRGEGQGEGVTVVDVKFAIAVLKGMSARDMVPVLHELIDRRHD